MKFLSLLLCFLLLTGCGSSTQSPSVTTAPPVVLTVFSPNASADGFVQTEVSVEAVTSEVIVEQLIEAGVLGEGAVLNRLDVTTDSGSKTLAADFNDRLPQAVLPMGTSGEYVIMGSVINTLLSAYDADSVLITVNGEVLETGHSIYDQPLTFYSSFS